MSQTYRNTIQTKIFPLHTQSFRNKVHHDETTSDILIHDILCVSFILISRISSYLSINNDKF